MTALHDKSINIWLGWDWVKGIVHPKMKTYPQAIQDVDEFVSSSEQN